MYTPSVCTLGSNANGKQEEKEKNDSRTGWMVLCFWVSVVTAVVEILQ